MQVNTVLQPNDSLSGMLVWIKIQNPTFLPDLRIFPFIFGGYFFSFKGTDTNNNINL